MNSGKEQISSKQLMFSVGCFIQGSALLTGFVAGVTKQDTWIAVISGFVISLVIIGLYNTLANRFPGKNIIQISFSVFGPIFGRVVSLFYVFFFLSLAFLNTDIMGDFYAGYIMPETPKIVFEAMLIFICAWAVRKGVETMTRYSVLFVILAFLVLFFNSILLISSMKFNNFLPAFTLPIKKYVQASHTMAILPFSEIFIFFMFFPNVKNPDGIKKAMYGGLLIGSVTFFINVLRDISVLGSVNALYTSPTFEVVRLINVGNVLTRFEVLYATILVILLFFKVSMVYYAAVYGVAEIFGLRSYRILVPAFGVIIVVLALSVFESAIDSAYWGKNFSAVYSTFFEVILPLLTLIVAAVRKKLKNKEVEST